MKAPVRIREELGLQCIPRRTFERDYPLEEKEDKTRGERPTKRCGLIPASIGEQSRYSFASRNVPGEHPHPANRRSRWGPKQSAVPKPTPLPLLVSSGPGELGSWPLLERSHSWIVTDRRSCSRRRRWIVAELDSPFGDTRTFDRTIPATSVEGRQAVNAFETTWRR